MTLLEPTEHTSATLNGLEPGTKYTITVTAQNLVGKGPAAKLTASTKATASSIDPFDPEFDDEFGAKTA